MKYRTINNLTARTLGLIAGLGLTAGTALAQDYGFDWVTIGDPGNRDTRPHEVTKQPDLEIGGVDYEYRIMQTSATATDHLEFVQAVWPYIPRNERLLSEFTGYWILSATGNKDDPQYYIRNGKDRVPTGMSFRTAAKFANWLHNGKADGAWAIADGAYDTSTFGKDDDGFLTDQERRHPDARVWLPSMDEMAKAMYWDPDKDGGEGGYWLYQHSKNEVPISGLPDEGGETNAGLDLYDVPYMDVGSYPWAASPWGVLDGSGGALDIVEDMDPRRWGRLARGTEQYESFNWDGDRLDTWRPAADFALYGVRFAAAIPSPPGLFVLGGMFTYVLTRRKR